VCGGGGGVVGVRGGVGGGGGGEGGSACVCTLMYMCVSDGRSEGGACSVYFGWTHSFNCKIARHFYARVFGRMTK